MYVIGTAGHVDHGKSTLVKALTGIDPDRWAEEQRREMTIDLGFAWLTLPSGRSVSLVDVPGHERFIKNMLAGVGGIDAALLVIAADEAIMPQTAEHLAILDLLGVSHGLVVLTKADLVDEEWLALVGEDVRERLAATSFAHAPQIAVSARTGQGLDALLAALDQQLDQTPTRAAARGAPRMSVDRAFTIGGFGAVVTGTLADGPLQIGDEVEILPRRLRARVRGLQTHQQKQDQALPGTRVAINLSGVSHHDIARGDVLARPGLLQPTELIDVQVRLVADLPRPLAQNTPLDLFVGAAETLCRATLLDCEELLPGESGWLQLRLDRPIAVARGDRYIVRQPSPGLTIGGGKVIDPHPQRHRRFRAEVIGALEALARGTPADLLRRPLADDGPHAWAELVRGSGLGETAAQAGLAELVEAGEVVILERAHAGEQARDTGHQTPDAGEQARDTGHQTSDAGGQARDARHETPDAGGQTRDARHETPDAGDQDRLPSPVSRLVSPVSRLPSRVSRLPSPVSRLPSPVSRLPSPVSASTWLISAKGWATLQDKLLAALRGYHRRYPLRSGMPREELRSRLKLSGAALEAVLAAAQGIGVGDTSVRLAEHQPQLDPGQQRAVTQLLRAFSAAPYSPPAPDLDPEVLAWLLEQGQIVRVSDDVAFLPGPYAEMVEWVRGQIGAAGSATVAQFRDRFGTSRKYALALLEHLDERKVTRRAGDARVLY